MRPRGAARAHPSLRFLRALVGLAVTLGACTGRLTGTDDAGPGLDATSPRIDGAVPDGAPDDGGGRPPDDLGVDDAALGADAGPDAFAFDGGPPDPCRVAVEIPTDCTGTACRQVQRQMGTTCSTLGYLEASPLGYGAGPVPLLVFLHGLNQAGNGMSELERVDDFGIPRIIADGGWSESRPFLVLSPQHSGVGPCFTADELRDFLDFAYRAYDVDRSRVYVTGLSCGGIGLWNYLGLYGDSQGLAGAVPIAGDGRGPWSSAGCALGRVPIWAFHGDADDVVSVEGTRVPVLGLQACEPRPDIEMVLYAGVGHDSWSATYDGSGGHDIYAWMLAHRR